MSEVHFDPVVANRFISSLSKSLQALCHGCMDFDSGLEIGGHIYIKIDYESKVDYVLDEKVEKGNDNSMKFVSNSFLAKKDKPKQTLDGSCSPVQELQTTPPTNFHQRTPYQHPGSQHPGSQHQRPVHPYSNTSTSGGECKRGSSAVKTTDRKRSRPPSYGSNSSSIYPSTSGNTNNDDHSFLQHSLPNTDIDNSNRANVKQEFHEGESNQTSDSIHEESNYDSIDSKMNIKNEPDTAFENEVERTAINKLQFSEETNPKSADGISVQHMPASTSSTNYEQFSDQTQCASNSNNKHPDDMQTHSKSSFVPATDRNNELNASSEVSVHFNAESVYPESSQGNTGESLNFGGDFDVIEIDDEDEEMDGMFDGSHEQNPVQHGTSIIRNLENKPGDIPNLSCSYCQFIPANPKYLNMHMSTNHPGQMPYKCTICDKGYMSFKGLWRHKHYHQGTKHQCPFCTKQFTQKHNMNRHLHMAHSNELFQV